MEQKTMSLQNLLMKRAVSQIRQAFSKPENHEKEWFIKLKEELTKIINPE